MGPTLGNTLIVHDALLDLGVGSILLDFCSELFAHRPERTQGKTRKNCPWKTEDMMPRLGLRPNSLPAGSRF